MNYIDWLNQKLGMPEEAAALCREHLEKNGMVVGGASGVFLFDGENILRTQNQTETD